MENVDYGSGDNGGVPAVQPEGLLEKAVILCFRTGRFGNSRKVKQSQVAELAVFDSDGTEKIIIGEGKKSKALKLNRQLLDSKELEAITSHDGKTRVTILRKWCVPSFADEGYYFVPLVLVPEVDEYLSEREAERKDLVEAFYSVYEGLQVQAQSEQGALYRVADYPEVGKVKSSFTWTVRYLAFSTPGKLQEISQSLYQRERDRLAATWQQAGEEVREALREAWSGLVDHFVERLSYKPGGKPQAFKDTLVGNMTDFIALFDKRNLTDDDELSAIIGQARSLLSGVDPEQLRKDLPVRDRIRQSFEEIKRASDSFLVDKPARQIDFDD